MVAVSGLAQQNREIIRAQNIAGLRSFSRIDFDKFPSDIGAMDLGWFALSQTGDRLAVRDPNNQLVILDRRGRIIDRYAVPGRDYFPSTVVDATFNEAGNVLVSVHLDGVGYNVAYRHIENQTIQYFRFDTRDYPLRIWIDRPSRLWLEVSPADASEQRKVIHLPTDIGERFQSGDTVPEEAMTTLPSGPENDPDAFLRIGRIQAPLALTTTQNGLLSRWNLETGQVTATAQLDILPGLGQVNATAQYFGWRDAQSTALYLLDFETGENWLVAPLLGRYVPFLVVTRNGDVIIGVNIDSESVVVAWDAVTGQRHELGEYRPCNRQPDMVRLSQDGTTLVIGCDTGLDIWQIEGDAV
jgi:hypothetical protein